MKRDYCYLVDLKHIHSHTKRMDDNSMRSPAGLYRSTKEREWRIPCRGSVSRLFMHNVLNFPIDVIVLARNLFPHMCTQIEGWLAFIVSHQTMFLLFRNLIKIFP